MIVTAEAEGAPLLAEVDPEAVTELGEHELTRVAVIAGRAKPSTSLAPVRHSQR